MNKKLQKYITSYELLKSYERDIIHPDGGMILLVNLGSNFDFIIEDETYSLKQNQAVLINALERDLYLNEYKELALIRFKGAGASFFFDEHMETLMFEPLLPIFLDEEIITEFNEKELDKYFQERFKASSLPFNIMKIVELLDEQGSHFNIDEVLAIANCPRKILDKAFRLRAGLTFKTYSVLKERAN